ncbi:glycoside hydrolase family 130 protein [Syntrophomonas curvata]
MTQLNRESLFDQTMKEIAPRLTRFTDYDLVIGIPFLDEQERLAALLNSVDQVLQSWIGRRQLIVCAGDISAGQSLRTVKNLDLKHPHIEFLMPAGLSGRGMSVRAILEICQKLDADLLLFSASMAGTQKRIEKCWLDSLLTPIQGPYDMVLASLRRHSGIDSIAHMLAAPVLESFYGCRVSDPLGGIYAIAHDFIAELAHEARFWGESIGGYGIDFWILTRALSWNKSICELNLGGEVAEHDLAKRNRIFYEVALTIFEAIKRDSAIWLQDRLVIKVADILARSEVRSPDPVNYPILELLTNFINGCTADSALLRACLPEEAVKEIVANLADNFHISDQVWVKAVTNLLLHYAFEDEPPEKILRLLTAIYNGRIASHILDMDNFKKQLPPCAEKDELMVQKMDSIRHHLSSELWRAKPEFNQRWLSRQEQVKPPIIPLGYMEYVPGKPVVVPKKIAGKDRRMVSTDNIFKELRKRYEKRFVDFMTASLGISCDSPPQVLVAAVQDFMAQAESTLDGLLPGDLRREEGLQSFVNALFKLFPEQRMFTINSDLLREMVVRFPPVNLMIPMGFYKPRDLLARMDARDIITFANLVDSWNYTDRDLIWLLDNLKPESFEWVDLKPLVITEELRTGILSQGKISNLNRVTARIVVKGMEADKGGKYPKMRYFTGLVRRMAVAEDYSQLFTLNAAERKNISNKMGNSLLGLQRGDEFSAHSIFENNHHRGLVSRIRQLARDCGSRGDKDAARIFGLLAESYGLSQVLEDNTFLTCTAWSWSSYSFKGGLNIPTPLTTSVESRWFNHEFLEFLYEELGYDPDEIMQIVFRHIQNGKSNQNLLDTLLPTRPKDVAVVVQETTNEPSKHLQRYEGNPLLEPLDNSPWENKYVLNPGAIRLGDKVYLFYRAVGEDNISHIGLAISDGYRILERLPEPILSPEIPEEKMGCEDARVIRISDRLYMLYTAYDGNVAQIAAASIKVDDFIQGKYNNWCREGLAFKNIWDKDAIIFPEKINGKYVVYHRIEPSIWVTYCSEIKFPLKDKHAIIVGPRPGRMWDSLKIGAGAQPLKTKYGWLLIYHGVDHNYVYRLGVLLVDLNNPQKVIYRSPNPILEPEEDYEIGLSGAWVPNVVFTCGAVPGVDKETLEDSDEILVYYGAADTSIGLAKATLADLIPETFRSS